MKIMQSSIPSSLLENAGKPFGECGSKAARNKNFSLFHVFRRSKINSLFKCLLLRVILSQRHFYYGTRGIVQIAYHLRQKYPLHFASSHNTRPAKSNAHLTKSNAHFASENAQLFLGPANLPMIMTKAHNVLT